MSSDWPASSQDVNDSNNLRATRKINMKNSCRQAEVTPSAAPPPAAATESLTDNFPNDPGTRAMGYYDQDYLNYYYYMASQFALSDRWFSPVASKTTPTASPPSPEAPRKAWWKTRSGRPSGDSARHSNHLPRTEHGRVSWKNYYSVTHGGCALPIASTCGGACIPDTTFNYLITDSNTSNGDPTNDACALDPLLRAVVGDPENWFCIDPTHIAPITQYYTDVTNGTLPSFVWIDPGYGLNDEHPGSGSRSWPARYRWRTSSMR